MNCTLKKAPEASYIYAVINKAVNFFKDLEVESIVIRIIDSQVKFGVTSDEGGTDEWSSIFA